MARHLREAWGATCLDCDQLAHEVTACNCVHSSLTLRAHVMHTACAPYAHRMHTACTPHAHRMHAACTLHITCTLHTQAYAPGTAACAALVAAFGAEIVGDGGAIDRRALGGKVFADKAAMSRLCEIVWPATAALAAARIAGCGVGLGGLVVMEAAVMLEAGCAAAPCIRGCSPMY